MRLCDLASGPGHHGIPADARKRGIRSLPVGAGIASKLCLILRPVTRRSKQAIGDILDLDWAADRRMRHGWRPWLVLGTSFRLPNAGNMPLEGEFFTYCTVFPIASDRGVGWMRARWGCIDRFDPDLDLAIRTFDSPAQDAVFFDPPPTRTRQL